MHTTTRLTVCKKNENKNQVEQLRHQSHNSQIAVGAVILLNDGTHLCCRPNCSPLDSVLSSIRSCSHLRCYSCTPQGALLVWLPRQADTHCRVSVRSPRLLPSPSLPFVARGWGTWSGPEIWPPPAASVRDELLLWPPGLAGHN